MSVHIFTSLPHCPSRPLVGRIEDSGLLLCLLLPDTHDQSCPAWAVASFGGLGVRAKGLFCSDPMLTPSSWSAPSPCLQRGRLSAWVWGSCKYLCRQTWAPSHPPHRCVMCFVGTHGLHQPPPLGT